MATSKVYYYDFNEHIFGEYQSGFNFNLVLDETKDSAKIIVLTKKEEILKPNTIVRLEGIDFWWCVKKDTRQRHLNEVGYEYEHTLELQGAFEILNSRDLTNCGFNTEHYTVGDFLDRLISLSSYELPISFDYGNYLSSSKVVNFLKTFENYTLASAIKEFLNGYNCLPKMVFTKNSDNEIVSATIKIYSKSGLTDTPLSEDVFNDASAVDNIDRESYATKVISNIQNCVGRKPIRYPRVGGAYLVGDNGTITFDTAGQAKLLLPSNVYAVESITLYGALKIKLESDGHTTRFIILTPDDLTRKGNKCRDNIVYWLNDYGLSQDIITLFTRNWDSIFASMKPLGMRTIRNGGYYDAINDEPYGDYQWINNRYSQTPPHLNVYLNNERYAYNNDGNREWIISWKQGSNEIKGFDFFKKAQGTVTNNHCTNFFNEEWTTTVSYESESFTLTIESDEDGSKLTLIDFTEGEGAGSLDIPHFLASVEYIPMGDIKFKTDNNISGEDVKLYNQNGKLVDSYAVSKLVNSYCKSIRDKDLVRFGTYYKFTEIPKLGARVGDYVVNNISYDVYDNDNGGFVYKCQFSLNLYSICKSTMINANTNIRDYDCPQSNNVKRIQTYRDYIEISYEYDNIDTTYLDKDKILHIDLDYIGINDDLVFVMRSTDNSFTNQGDNNSHNLYYHLDHVSFDLSKQKKFVIDFGDNNIIGYGNAHAYKPFQLENIFDRTKSVVIPISYVDNYGETEGLQLIACDQNQAEINFGNTYISESVAISVNVYANFSNNSILRIDEPNYDKDGLEIPVFEYSCEIGGDDNIEVADNFFEYGENYDKFVAIKFAYPINNENASMILNGTMVDATVSFGIYEMQIATASGRPSSAKGHWGIYAKKGNEYRFLFALNNYPREYVDGNKISCRFNYYKLK